MQGDQVSADPDFFIASAHVDPSIERPHVVVLEQDGEPEAMLVGRIERLALATKLGYRTVYAPKVRSLTIVYGGILGEGGDSGFRTLLSSDRNSLAEHEADVAIFRYLPIDSSVYRIASTEVPLLTRQHLGEPEVHWELDLPRSLDEFLRTRSKSTRNSLTRTMRRLERTYDDRLEVRRYADPAGVDEFFRAVETISPKTYQAGLGVGFRDTPAHRGRVLALMEQGRYRGWVLHLEGRPVAFEHGALYRGRFRSGRPGYDPDFANLSVGTYLFLQTLAELCSDRDARVVDHGTGDADYKRRFGTRSWQEANAVLYAPTLKGIRINLARTVLQTGVVTARRVIGRGELAQSVKRRWREQLSRGE
jgi:CelD/BcsL family acetyltransferase involved in cellulose biosynthesis